MKNITAVLVDLVVRIIRLFPSIATSQCTRVGIYKSM